MTDQTDNTKTEEPKRVTVGADAGSDHMTFRRLKEMSAEEREAWYETDEGREFTRLNGKALETASNFIKENNARMLAEVEYLDSLTEAFKTRMPVPKLPEQAETVNKFVPGMISLINTDNFKSSLSIASSEIMKAAMPKKSFDELTKSLQSVIEFSTETQLNLYMAFNARRIKETDAATLKWPYRAEALPQYASSTAAYINLVPVGEVAEKYEIPLDTLQDFKESYAKVDADHATIMEAIGAGKFPSGAEKQGISFVGFAVSDDKEGWRKYVTVPSGTVEKDLEDDRFEFLKELGDRVTDEETGEASYHFNMLSYPYLTLCLFVALGYEVQLKAILRPIKRRRRGNQSPKEMLVTNSRADVAIYNHNTKDAIMPVDYFSNDRKKYSTGKNGMAVTIALNSDFDITEELNRIELNGMDRYTLSWAYTLAKDSNGELYGSDILKAMGYTNPKSETAIPALQTLATSLQKSMKTQIIIDTTEEQSQYEKRRGRDLKGALTFTRLMNANMTLLDLETERDFKITLLTPDGGEPADAFPLQRYGESKGQITSLCAEEFKFESVKRLSMEHKAMWRYIMTEARWSGKQKEKGGYITIKWSDLWRDMGRAGEDNRRMQTTCLKMLDERAGIACDKNGKPYQKPTIDYKIDGSKGFKIKCLDEPK